MPESDYTDIVIHGDGPLWWVTCVNGDGAVEEMDLDAQTEREARTEAAAILDTDVDADGANLTVEYH